jgi:chromate reductase
MSEVRQVAVVVGSLRAESINRKVARALVERAPDGLSFRFIDIGTLPLYNADLEAQPPAAWTEFRAAIGASDAVLFVTPEYNRSVPGVLKNAIDVGSRPPKENAWSGKPGAVVSATTGALGGLGANHHLRQSLVPVNVATMPSPELYVSAADKLFDEHGALANEVTDRLFRRFMAAFAGWIARHGAPAAGGG